MTPEDIKEMSYSFVDLTMTITFKKPIYCNQRMRKEFRYKTDYETFKQKVNKWLKFK